MSEDMRELPTSELDAQMMMTNSVWGRSDVPQELKEKLMKYYETKDTDGRTLTDKDGNVIMTKGSMWGLLGFFTRDMRLGNLSEWNNELPTCRFYIDFANDCLDEDYTGAFLLSLGRSATILETSQSKGGFLRKIINTLTQKNISQTLEPPKKAFFGGKKQDGGY